jgi:arylsulfatase A-like enzyme
MGRPDVLAFRSTEQDMPESRRQSAPTLRSQQEVPMTRPNIVLVITDQQTRATIATYGNERTHTPNMDALAADGVAFEKSYCASPLCSPGRAGILTGQMPHTAKVNVNDVPMRDDIPNVGQVFRDAGYETAWAGKWNLPESFPEAAAAIPGFLNLDWQRGSYRDLGASMDEDITDEAVRYLSGDRPGPFFLGVSLYDPHDICLWIMDRDHDVLPEVPEGASLPELPANFDADANESEFVRWLRRRDAELPGIAGGIYGWTELRWTEAWDERHWRRYLYVYDRLVELVDIQIGRVLGAIRDQGLEDDTLVVFTSDHGEGVAAHRWVTKEMLYEEPVTVPLILRWPGVIPSGRFDTTHLVSSIDIAPTLYDYAAVTESEGLAGRSLRPIVDDPALPGREYVVTELQPDPFRMELKGRMVRTERYKYIAFSAGSDPEMLFDLERDPLETTNLAPSGGHQSVVAEHRRLLESWTNQTNDEFATGVTKL